MSCYGPENKPRRVPESSQQAQHYKRVHKVKDRYSNVANERGRKNG